MELGALDRARTENSDITDSQDSQSSQECVLMLHEAEMDELIKQLCLEFLFE